MNLNREIIILQEELFHLNEYTEELQTRLEDMRREGVSYSQSMSGMPTGGEVSDKIGGHVGDLDEIERLIDVNLEKIRHMLATLKELIYQIDEPLRSILWFRYIDSLIWEDVAYNMGMTRGKTWNIFNNWLKGIDK